MLPTQFRLIWPNGFRGEEYKKSANQKQGSHVAAMFVNRSGRNEQSLQRAFHKCDLPRFGSFDQAVSEQKIFQESTNRQHELPVPAMFVNGSKMSNLLLPTKFRFIWVSGFRGEDFQKSTNQKQELPMTAMFVKGSGLNQQSLQIYREPAIYASYQVRFIWPSGFRVEEFFRNRPITLKK